MADTPHLLTDVKFSERRKGYDPEEVDNFLERVSTAVAQLQDKLREATTRAEEADTKIADAEKSRTVAEAQVEKLKADLAQAPVGGGHADVDSASKVLLLAQKTADAAIEEANATAAKTVADAKAKALTVVAEAEQDAERVRTDARRQADQLVQERSTAVLEEVRGLEDVRDQLNRDVEALNRHLDEQRAAVRGGIESLQRVIDDPSALRSAPTPGLSGASLADVRPVPSTPRWSPDDSESTDSSSADEPADHSDTPTDHTPVDHAPSTDDAESEGSDEHRKPLLAPPVDPNEDFPDVKVPTILEAPEHDDSRVTARSSGEFDLTTERLFSPPADDADAGPPTALFSPFPEKSGEDEPPLGRPDPADDEAMRAFFEADFDEEKAGGRRFGRRG